MFIFFKFGKINFILVLFCLINIICVINFKFYNKIICDYNLEVVQSNFRKFEDPIPYNMAYSNPDPVIKTIEEFLYKNKNKLSQEELIKIENKRQERIKEVMDQRFLEYTAKNKISSSITSPSMVIKNKLIPIVIDGQNVKNNSKTLSVFK